MAPRLFTLDDANRLVRPLDGLLARAQSTTAQMRHVRDQIVDLGIIWGDAIDSTSCPDHAEYTGYLGRFTDLSRDLEAITADVHALGVELKDVENGLVDFQAARGSEVVYLCWRRGEDAIRHWHPLEGGFAARRPIQEF